MTSYILIYRKGRSLVYHEILIGLPNQESTYTPRLESPSTFRNILQ